MHVWSSTQHPTEVQHGVAHLLGLPFNAVTVEVRRMGGAFGGKESQATIIAGIAALLAWQARQPVKLRLPRDDDMRATGKRHPFLIRYDVGFDAEGHILALDLTLAANGGNVADHTPAVLTRALCHADNCYFLPNVRIRGLACKTNTVSNTAFRGYGGPQAMLAIETIIEEVARRLGLSVHAVRRRNFYGIGRNDVTPYGMRVEDNIIERVVDELDHTVGLAAWRREIVNFNHISPVVKKGLATMPVKFGISFNRPALNQAGALVHVYTDGSVVLNHGGTEMGQGLFIKVAQVVAEAFAIDLDHIRVSATSTAKVPNTSPTADRADASLVTSSATTSTSTPASAAALRKPFAFAVLRMVATTVSPLPANATAVRSPIPVEQPVTITTDMGPPRPAHEIEAQLIGSCPPPPVARRGMPPLRPRLARP